MPEPITILGFGAGVMAVGGYLARRFFGVAKEVFDVVVGFVAFILCLPLLGLCAVLIKVSSRGPVFFRQQRVGRGGVVFEMVKLRTMHADWKGATQPTWTEENDPRVIPACRWMRRTHLDELPQLLNVIKGEMSLIGPRPERPEIVAEIEKACPGFSKRHLVRPGITGLAQVRNGYAASVDSAIQKLRADMEYIEQQKWSNELRILAGTVPKIFGDSKAR